MKKTILLTSIVIIAIFTVVSCNKKEESYSCNESANEWVKKKRNSNQNISRLQLVKYGIDTQFAIFRSLSDSNKKRIFFEKIAYIVANYNLSTSEISHLESLYTGFQTSFYEENNEDLDAYIADWESYAKSNLNWDEAKIALYVHTWLSQDDLAMLPSGGGGGGTTKPDCTCNLNAWCDWLGNNYICSKSIDCKPKGGCGFIGTKECKGKCTINL